MRKSSDWNSSPTVTVWYEIVFNSTMVKRPLCVHPRLQRSRPDGHELDEIAADIARLLQAPDRCKHRVALAPRKPCSGHVAKLLLDVRFAHSAFRVASRVAASTRLRFTRRQPDR